MKNNDDDVVGVIVYANCRKECNGKDIILEMDRFPSQAPFAAHPIVLQYTLPDTPPGWYGLVCKVLFVRFARSWRMR
jgi:hypothetical protein